MTREELDAQCSAMRERFERILALKPDFSSPEVFYHDARDIAQQALSFEAGRERLYEYAEYKRQATEILPGLQAENCELLERLRKAEEARDAAISLMAEASRELGETQGKLMVSEWPVLDGWMERAQNAEQERDQLRAELERCKADNTHSALREQYQRAVDELDLLKKDAERYRFLKDGSRTGSTFIQAYIGGEWCQAREDAADSAIDAAMKEANNG